jgi:transaldolase
MKFFIDTANLTEIREAASLGVLDGVTTNPSLVAKEGQRDFKGLIRQICDIVDGPVSAEVVSTEFNGMMKEAEELAALHKNVVVKIPIIREGLKAIKRCAAQGIRVNTTLVFSASQALLAAKAGAAYVSPFIGRLDDVSEEGMNLIRQIRRIFDNYGFECEILAASIRHPLHVVDAALAGADAATIPHKVIDQLLSHPLTDAGLKKFLEDWKKIS